MGRTGGIQIVEFGKELSFASYQMKYEAATDLISRIYRLENKFEKAFYFRFFGCIIGSFYVIYSDRQAPIAVDVLGAIFLFGTMALIHYKDITAPAKFITKTAIEVEIGDNLIILRTLPYKVFFFVTKPSMQLNFEINNVKVTSVYYPQKNFFDLDSNVIKLDNRAYEGYVILDYFDGEVGEKIKEFYY